MTFASPCPQSLCFSCKEPGLCDNAHWAGLQVTPSKGGNLLPRSISVPRKGTSHPQTHVLPLPLGFVCCRMNIFLRGSQFLKSLPSEEQLFGLDIPKACKSRCEWQRNTADRRWPQSPDPQDLLRALSLHGYTVATSPNSRRATCSPGRRDTLVVVWVDS